jgi:hypothetical protein
MIMSTASLPGWLQVVLIWLTGVVGWLLLRPYRRITQLGGKDSSRAVTSVGNWHRLFMRDVRQTAALQIIESGGTREPKRGAVAETQQRPESRTESVVVVGAPTTDRPPPPAGRPETAAPPQPAREPVPSGRRVEQRGAGWTEPDVADGPPSYTIYRPGSGEVVVPANQVRRPESARTPR